MAEVAAEPVTPEKEKIQIRDLTDSGAAKDAALRYTKRFHMDWEDESGKVHSGTFQLTRPTIGGQARIGVIMAELREDKPASSMDRNTFTMHEWIAVCTVWVTEKPSWFDVNSLYEAEPLQRVYLEALAFKQSFRTERVG